MQGKKKTKQQKTTNERLSMKYISAPRRSTYLLASTRVAPMNKMNKLCHPQQEGSGLFHFFLDFVKTGSTPLTSSFIMFCRRVDKTVEQNPPPPNQTPNVHALTRRCMQVYKSCTAFTLLAPCWGSVFTTFIRYLGHGRGSRTRVHAHTHFHTHTHTHTGGRRADAQAHSCISDHTLKLSPSSCPGSSEMRRPFFTWLWASQPNFHIGMSSVFGSLRRPVLAHPCRLSVSRSVRPLVCLSGP